MDNQEIIQEIVLPFLQGEDLNKLIIKLSTYSMLKDENARCFFKTEANQHEKEQILQSLLGRHKGKIDHHIKEYNDWILRLNISDSLLHFLEFLAHKDSHRIRYLVKQIYQTKAPIKYQKGYLSLISGIFCAGVYFTYHEEAWTQFLIWLKVTLPYLGIKILNVCLKPYNLSLIILMYQTIRYFVDIYLILRNNATSKEHKINKICRITLTNSLNIAGQLINFIFASLESIAGYLFILSGLIGLIWSLSELYYLKNEQKPDVNLYRNFEDYSKAYEKYYYYIKKESQFKVECIAIFFTFAASLLSILLGHQVLCLGTICAVLQFLISQTKSYYHQLHEHQYAVDLQTEIRKFGHLNPSTHTSHKIQSFFDIQRAHALQVLKNPHLSEAEKNKQALEALERMPDVCNTRPRSLSA